MNIELNQIKEILTAIAANNIAELTLKSDDFELTVRKGVTNLAHGDSHIATAIPTAAPTTVQVISTGSLPPQTSSAMEKKWIDIPSPIVGTFYRSSGPDESPYVQIGDRIRIGQVVCIIEAMKVMNEIESEVSGQVMDILVQNAQTVEFGQVLMRIQPE
ncbi:MAG TPA: acetyl-CoA carboxylase biotin carboxyl carrier protein [Allocoleopsis sp.]